MYFSQILGKGGFFLGKGFSFGVRAEHTYSASGGGGEVREVSLLSRKEFGISQVIEGGFNG